MEPELAAMPDAVFVALVLGAIALALLVHLLRTCKRCGHAQRHHRTAPASPEGKRYCHAITARDGRGRITAQCDCELPTARGDGA
jgi:hypothetical protein